MQPHRPYLGETGEMLRERLDLQGYGQHDEGIQIWGAVKQRDVTIEEIRTAYTESLKIALESIEKLLGQLSGKSIVTSDHGRCSVNVCSRSQPESGDTWKASIHLRSEKYRG